MTLPLQHSQTVDQSFQPTIYEIDTRLLEAEDSETAPVILGFCVQALKDLKQAERKERFGSMLSITWNE
jgi:hypothetical protein